MTLKRHLARLAKLLVDKQGISFGEAQTRLEALKLEIIIGDDAVTPAAQTAILTAVAVGSRSFVGGVGLRGALDLPLNTALPLAAATLGEAARLLGAQEPDGTAAARIAFGSRGGIVDDNTIYAWWDGWRAGVAIGEPVLGLSDNPLAGIAAGALAVGAAFQMASGGEPPDMLEVDLWPAVAGGDVPAFADVFLPSALWLIGLGNLGQAYLWALAALPYAEPHQVALVLQDDDRISEENWATSILVREETYGLLKTKVAEAWAEAKRFSVRRVDRKLLPGDRLDLGDPCVALSGVDKLAVRQLMAATGFECVVDAGLGHDAKTFDRYRVTVFDQPADIVAHFGHLKDPMALMQVPDANAYRDLETEIGRCGAVEIAGAAIATPFVSALAASVAVSRIIALAIRLPMPRERGWLHLVDQFTTCKSAKRN